jgi:hypothetical protein
MLVSSTAFQNESGKYLKLVEKEDVYIQKHGKIVATLTSKNKPTPITDKYSGILKGKYPDDITMKDIKEERLREKYGFGM